MLFTELELRGAFIVEPQLLTDERGHFARTWCQREFEARGLKPHIKQCNTSLSRWPGTIRGMHYQAKPHEEAKLVRCTSGAIYDVIIDLRPDSETYTRWLAIELTAAKRMMLYIPEGMAHGFQALVDNSEVFYQMTEFYTPECQDGYRYDDPAFGIHWPLPAKNISQKDMSWPLFAVRTPAAPAQLASR